MKYKIIQGKFKNREHIITNVISEIDQVIDAHRGELNLCEILGILEDIRYRILTYHYTEE